MGGCKRGESEVDSGASRVRLAIIPALQRLSVNSRMRDPRLMDPLPSTSEERHPRRFLRIRNVSSRTEYIYIHMVACFAAHFPAQERCCQERCHVKICRKGVGKVPCENL